MPISEVLRTRMYATDYRELQMARASYAELGAGASACLSCTHQRCTGSCPYGLDVPGLTRSTPEILAERTGSSSGRSRSENPTMMTGPRGI